MPVLRQQFVFQVCTTVATSALWIAVIFVPYPGKIGILVAANGVERPVGIFLASPASDRLLSGGWQRYLDIDHYIERVEGFFVIILGEGVFRLIGGSPSGPAITYKSGTVLTALFTYYLLHWLYFNGDHSKEFVHIKTCLVEGSSCGNFLTLFCSLLFW